MTSNPNHKSPILVEIFEVGPRDGLQNEKVLVPTLEKVKLIEQLVASGVKRIQVTSFVHPKYVPQMADAEELCANLSRKPGVIYSGLALNVRGVERAFKAGLGHVDISVSANDEHSRRNSNVSLEEAVVEFDKMFEMAQDHKMLIRGGIQCAFGYIKPGDVSPETVAEIARHYFALGVDEFALADTAGLANPRQISEMLELILPLAGGTPVMMHLHDTRGMGLANVFAALQFGIRYFDTAFGGLGGCPFIEGAAGNIPTEDTVYMLQQMGFETGVDWQQVGKISRKFEHLLEKTSMPSKIYNL